MTDFAQAREAMVDCQVRPSDVTRYTIIDAMLSVPRENFVPQNMRDVAYAGQDIEFAPNRVVLDPRVAAKMLDAVAIGPQDMVLNIGCGYGYLAALIGNMAEAVVATEPDTEIAEQAVQILAQIEADNVIVETAELTAGAPEHGPYDVVVLEGAVEVIPETILDQVKDGGKIVAIFRENGVGQCRLGQKAGDIVSWRRAFDATAPVLPGFNAEKHFEF